MMDQLPSDLIQVIGDYCSLPEKDQNSENYLDVKINDFYSLKLTCKKFNRFLIQKSPFVNYIIGLAKKFSSKKTVFASYKDALIKGKRSSKRVFITYKDWSYSADSYGGEIIMEDGFWIHTCHNTFWDDHKEEFCDFYLQGWSTSKWETKSKYLLRVLDSWSVVLRLLDREFRGKKQIVNTSLLLH